jgi:SAM-dependent methyltransferase
MYDDKQDWYFNFVRRDIEPLLPQHAARVLEVGCGAGATLAWLKQSGRADWVAGIELSEAAAEQARSRLDQVLQGEVEDLIDRFEPGSLDLVLCLDVLEHLVDPWAILARLRSLLRPGGQVIVSLPNVRHHSVLLPLLLRGQWRYREAGIMDRTHLRFFARDGARELLQGAGLDNDREHCTYAWGSRDRWKDRLSFGLLREFFAFQYLLSATRPLAEGTTR